MSAVSAVVSAAGRSGTASGSVTGIAAAPPLVAAPPAAAPLAAAPLVAAVVASRRISTDGVGSTAVAPVARNGSSATTRRPAPWASRAAASRALGRSVTSLFRQRLHRSTTYSGTPGNCGSGSGAT
ncbi:hypothetical protein COUCH_24545 [Couchioplanes caeruleus]|nr:hypothetical protein COUCH_24545 [Couchioplanes caeruleus]